MLVLLHAPHGIVVVVFLPAQRGLRYTQQTSLMRGGLPSCPVRPTVCVADFRSARRGMCGVFPFRPGRPARRSSVPPGAVYVEVFRSVWRGPVYAAVFCSVWCGPVCAAVFHSTRHGIGVPFCLARAGVGGGPPFCPARHARRSSILLSTACTAFFHSTRGGMRGGLPFRLVRHTRRCSVLSGAARYARRCCGSIKGGPGSLCWNCFSPLQCGAPTEATPQQQWRQQRHGEQRDGNDDGKGILVTTAWHSSIAVSFALFLLYSYTLLHSIE